MKKWFTSENVATYVVITAAIITAGILTPTIAGWIARVRAKASA